MEMRALLAAFFQRMQERHSGIQYGAKRMMGFFKRFVESEGIHYVVGAMAFNKDQLHQEGTSLHTHSYMRVWCDRCLLYTSPSPRDATLSRMPSSA